MVEYLPGAVWGRKTSLGPWQYSGQLAASNWVCGLRLMYYMWRWCLAWKVKRKT